MPSVQKGHGWWRICIKVRNSESFERHDNDARSAFAAFIFLVNEGDLMVCFISCVTGPISHTFPSLSFSLHAPPVPFPCDHYSTAAAITVRTAVTRLRKTNKAATDAAAL
jgi:hypothetical protein